MDAQNIKLYANLKNKVELKDQILKTANFNGEELLIFGFCTPVGIYPPFDHVEIRTHDKKKVYVVPISCCRFVLKLI